MSDVSFRVPEQNKPRGPAPKWTVYALYIVVAFIVLALIASRFKSGPHPAYTLATGAAVGFGDNTGSGGGEMRSPRKAAYGVDDPSEACAVTDDGHFRSPQACSAALNSDQRSAAFVGGMTDARASQFQADQSQEQLREQKREQELKAEEEAEEAPIDGEPKASGALGSLAQSFPPSPASADPMAQVMDAISKVQAQPAPVVNAAAPSHPAGDPLVEKRDAADFSLDIGAFNKWHGDRFAVFFGSVIHAKLLNQIDSDSPGTVACEVVEPLVSYDHQKVLVPVRSMVWGSTERVEMINQHRLALVFTLLQMPDGFQVKLGDLPAQDDKGTTGIKGHTNNHYMRLFGTSIALGVIGAGSIVGASSPVTGSGVDQLRYGFSSGMTSAAMQSFERLTNVMPTISIPSGKPVDVVLVGRNMGLPAYENHDMNPHQ